MRGSNGAALMGRGTHHSFALHNGVNNRPHVQLQRDRVRVFQAVLVASVPLLSGGTQNNENTRTHDNMNNRGGARARGCSAEQHTHTAPPPHTHTHAHAHTQQHPTLPPTQCPSAPFLPQEAAPTPRSHWRWPPPPDLLRRRSRRPVAHHLIHTPGCAHAHAHAIPPMHMVSSRVKGGSTGPDGG
jgi:hypothetical protein